MGVEENDDKPINLLEVQPEIPEQEPIEQVFSQEPEEVRPIDPSTESEDKQISKLHDELRKHSDARKKAERDILNIKKGLKDVLLVHHATIKDLQKQVAQMHRKIATIDSSRKATKVKTSAKNTSTGKKTKKKSKKR